MLRTVMITTYVSIQGTFVRTLANGLMQVKVGEKIYTGTPVSAG